MPLKIGICVRFNNPSPWARPWDVVYRDHLEYGRVAEQLGFDGIWVPEHHCVESGYNPAPFVALTALAHNTERCWLGTQPLLLPLYNPVMLAEQACVVDVLSSGRLILGIGAGYRSGDFDATGVQRAERGARMEEGITLLVKALESRKAFDFHGSYYRAKGVDIYPRPLQDPHPQVQLAVRSDAAARRAGRLGLAVNLSTPEGVTRYGPAVVEAREKAGTGTTRTGASLLRSGFLSRTREDAIRASRDYCLWDYEVYNSWQCDSTDPEDLRMVEARKTIGDGEPAGLYTADEWIRAIKTDCVSIEAQGLLPDWINVTLWPPGMRLGDALSCLERFADQVLPHVRRN